MWDCGLRPMAPRQASTTLGSYLLTNADFGSSVYAAVLTRTALGARDSRSASVRFTVQRRAPGRRSGSRCVAPRVRAGRYRLVALAMRGKAKSALARHGFRIVR